MDVFLYHNPACGTSRNTLALIRNAGVEPHVIEYLMCPPSRAMVVQIAERTGLGVRGPLRDKPNAVRRTRPRRPVDERSLCLTRSRRIRSC